jgi:hypothetical protein
MSPGSLSTQVLFLRRQRAAPAAPAAAERPRAARLAAAPAGSPTWARRAAARRPAAARAGRRAGAPPHGPRRAAAAPPRPRMPGGAAARRATQPPPRRSAAAAPRAGRPQARRTAARPARQTRPAAGRTCSGPPAPAGAQPPGSRLRCDAGGGGRRRARAEKAGGMSATRCVSGHGWRQRAWQPRTSRAKAALAQSYLERTLPCQGASPVAERISAEIGQNLRPADRQSSGDVTAVPRRLSCPRARRLPAPFLLAQEPIGAHQVRHMSRAHSRPSELRAASGAHTPGALLRRSLRTPH